jgi:hypothetical protein
VGHSLEKRYLELGSNLAGLDLQPEQLDAIIIKERQVVYKCYTPGMLEDARGATRAAIGDVVELFIGDHYCQTVRNPCFDFDPSLDTGPGPQTDFFDAFMGSHRCDHFAEYLNKHYSTDVMKIKSRCLGKKNEDNGRFPIPDIVTYVEDDWGEFYEIKPNSTSGRKNGLAKIKWFNDGPPEEPAKATGIVKEFGLRHRKGTLFNNKDKDNKDKDPKDPTKEKMLDGRYLGSPYVVWLEYWLDSPGLILWQFCLEIDVEFIEAQFAVIVWGAIVALLVIYAGRKRRVPESVIREWLSQTVSPLRGSVGNGGQNDISDIWYVQYLYSAYHWRTMGNGDTGFEFLLCHPPTEESSGECVPATAEIIQGWSPEGIFTPTDPGFRGLEVDAILALADAVPDEVSALILEHAVGEVTDEADEEEDDTIAGLITPTTAAIETVQGYLDVYFKMSQLPISRGGEAAM